MGAGKKWESIEDAEKILISIRRGWRFEYGGQELEYYDWRGIGVFEMRNIWSKAWSLYICAIAFLEARKFRADVLMLNHRGGGVKVMWFTEVAGIICYKYVRGIKRGKLKLCVHKHDSAGWCSGESFKFHLAEVFWFWRAGASFCCKTRKDDCWRLGNVMEVWS